MLGPRIPARPVVTSAQLVGKKVRAFRGPVGRVIRSGQQGRADCVPRREWGRLPGRRKGDYLVLKRIVGMSLKEGSGKGA